MFQGRQFGKSSEKSPDQAELFDEADESSDEEVLSVHGTEVSAEDEETVSTQPNKKSGRKALPK